MSFSFDSDLHGWDVSGADLDSPPVDWSIEQTTEVATRARARSASSSTA